MKNQHTRQHFSRRSLHRQNGSVLMWGMVILLTLTVIGVTAARMGVTDTRIAGNQMFGMMTYQGAESTLERITTLFHIKEAESDDNHAESWDFQDQVNRDTSASGSKNVTSVGTVSMGESLMCTAQEGFAMSVEMNTDAGGVSCRLFRVNARSRLTGSGARSQHAQGVMKYTPATGTDLSSGNLSE